MKYFELCLGKENEGLGGKNNIKKSTVYTRSKQKRNPFSYSDDWYVPCT